MDYSKQIEAIVFVSGKSIEVKDIAEKLGVSQKIVLENVKTLQKRYCDDCGIHLLLFNNKLQFCSNPNYSQSVESVLNPIKERELTKTMLEVASIIAYKQPITKSEIEEIRGVNSDYAVGILSENNLIEVKGRKDAVGKPLLFGTTDEFLKRFQISDLSDLPDYDALLERIRVLQPADSNLYRKDSYEPTEEEIKKEQEASIRREKFNEELKENINFSLPVKKKPLKQIFSEAAKEEIPDFLKDEKNLQKF